MLMRSLNRRHLNILEALEFDRQMAPMFAEGSDHKPSNIEQALFYLNKSFIGSNQRASVSTGVWGWTKAIVGLLLGQSAHFSEILEKFDARKKVGTLSDTIERVSRIQEIAPNAHVGFVLDSTGNYDLNRVLGAIRVLERSLNVSGRSTSHGLNNPPSGTNPPILNDEGGFLLLREAKEETPKVEKSVKGSMPKSKPRKPPHSELKHPADLKASEMVVDVAATGGTAICRGGPQNKAKGSRGHMQHSHRRGPGKGGPRV